MKRNEIILTAFIEGGLVMLLEIASPLVVAPVLGSSVNVWAALISISIAALAIGYFIGGRNAGKGATPVTVIFAFFVNTIILFLGWFMIWFQNNYAVMFDYRYFSWLIIFVVLFIPLVLFGSTTPLLIASVNNMDKKDHGVVGKIYSISTIGGIVFSILGGFYFIPALGISHTILLSMIITGILPLVFLFRQKEKIKYSLMIALLILGIFVMNTKTVFVDSSSIRLLEYSEGINGQLIVADLKKKDHSERVLFINRMGQTWFNTTTNYSVWEYPNYITSLGSMFHERTNSLVLGLGGGIVAKQLKEYCKHNVDAVELDGRIIEISKKYFNLQNTGVKIIQEDARRFIKKTKKKYNFLVFDIFNGEIIPSHGLSKESFEDVKKIMVPDGIMVINFNGFLSGKEGRSGRSLYKTLSAAGFTTKLFATGSGGENERNILYISYLKEPKWDSAYINVKTDKGDCKMSEHFMDLSKIDMSDAIIITDDSPMMEYLNRFAAARWREEYYNNFTLKFKEEYKIPLTK